MVVFLLSLVMTKLFGSRRLNMVELQTVLVGYRLLMKTYVFSLMIIIFIIFRRLSCVLR